MDTTNFLVSFAVLNSRGLASDKVLAASVGAAMIQGPIGLVLPLAVANASSSTSSSGSGVSAGAMVRVPKVTGKPEAEAKGLLKDKNLNAVSTFAFIEDDPQNQIIKGNVFQQEPAEGEFTSEGDDVSITVSLGPRMEEETLKDLHEDMDAKFDQVIALLKKAPNTAGSKG